MQDPEQLRISQNSGPQRQHFSGTVVIILLINFTSLSIFAWLLNQRYEQHQQDISGLHQLEERIFHIDKAFRLQIQEWKNILLRGHEAGAFDTYLSAFRSQEQTFQEIINKELDYKIPDTLSLAFENVKKHHLNISKVYNQSLNILRTGNHNFRAADRHARGIDRTLQRDLNGLHGEIKNFILNANKSSWSKLNKDGLIFILAMLIINLISLVLISYFTRRAFTSLDREELRLKNVMHAAPVGIFLFSKSGTLLIANKRGQTLLNFTEELPWYQHTHIDDTPTLLEKWQACLDSGEGFEFEFRIHQTDESIRWVAFNCMPDIQHGELSGFITCVIDITTAKAVEELLRSNEERLRIMLHALADAVIATDTEGRIQHINPSAELLCAWEHEKALDLHIEEVCQLICGTDDNSIRNPIYEAIESQDIIEIATDCKLLDQDDNEHRIDGCATPIFNDQGDLVGAVLVLRDISEKVQWQQQLRHAEKMQSVGQLTGGIAHDFNNMLGAIMGAAQVLDTKTPDSELNIRKYIQIIMRVSENAAELVRNLLAFSRKNAAEEEDICINDVVQQTLDIATHALRKDISLTFINQSHEIFCRGDQVAIQSALLNLFINAQDAMPSGGSLTVSLEQQKLVGNDWSIDFPHIEDGDFACIHIRDSGDGIPIDIREHIFEPFFTTKPRGKGTGLGLATVYGTVNSHHGCIRVESQISQGTSFYLYFPAIRGTEKHLSTAKKHAITIEQAASVLIVDDDDNLRPIIKSLISSLGYNTLTAAGGQEAIDLHKKHKDDIAVILLDLVMPNKSGRETFDEITSTQPNAKVILISGYDRGADSDYLMKHGAIAYLRKPFSMQELAEILDQHVQPKKA